MLPFNLSIDGYQFLVSSTISVILFWLVAYCFPKIRQSYRLPSGPWGLPFVGYLPFINRQDQYKQLIELSQKYGSVYSLRLGLYNVIFVGDWKHIEKALSNEALLDRPVDRLVDSMAPSLVEMSGDSWRAHRRLFLHTFHYISMENEIKLEIGQLMATLADGSHNIYQSLIFSISNNISCLLFGHGFKADEAYSSSLCRLLPILGSAKSLFSSLFTDSLPGFIKSRLPDVPDETELNLMKAESLQDFESHLQKEIDLHKAKTGLVSTKECDNYIDSYLLERIKLDQEDDIDYSDGDLFNEQILKQNVVAFYEQGTETVVSTLTWAFIYLIEYPECCDKIRDEIAKVIGHERSPNYSDRLKMPYTISFIYEVHRIVTVHPLNLFRQASHDTNIGLHYVPKDSLVLFSLYSINRDPHLWIQPDTFDPNRFLAEHGLKAVKPPFLIPFSGGKRSCLGEELANMQIFLYLICIMQKFNLKMDADSQIDPIKSEYRIIRRPKNVPKLIFEPIVDHSRFTINK